MSKEESSPETYALRFTQEETDTLAFIIDGLYDGRSWRFMREEKPEISQIMEKLNQARSN